MVVDVILRKWVTMVALAEEAVEPGATVNEGFGQDVQRLAAYLYVDNGILN